MQALKAAIGKGLRPVEGGLRYTAQNDITSVDALGNAITIPRGTVYNITGTKNGDGYVVTISDPAHSTYYLEAEEGCKLC
jgi:hypothetical protein